MRTKGMCAVVDWDSVRMGGADRAASGEKPCHVSHRNTACVRTGRRHDVTRRVLLHHGARGAGRGVSVADYTVLVVSAGGGGITAVGRAALAKELASGQGRSRRCGLQDRRLDGVCRAVQCLPRWPIAWLPGSPRRSRQESRVPSRKSLSHGYGARRLHKSCPTTKRASGIRPPAPLYPISSRWCRRRRELSGRLERFGSSAGWGTICAWSPCWSARPKSRSSSPFHTPHTVVPSISPPEEQEITKRRLCAIT